ncbi:MAG: tetratricopeptide repeat protein [Candidatus Brocadiae bacterium]|nr:tetratricopeptide repeat protein [Candidatus Brocadiia bacterium]
MKRAWVWMLAAAVAWADPCGSCGTEVPAEANFCPKCGTATGGAARKKVEDAAAEAEKKRSEYLDSLRALKAAHDDAGDAARAREVDVLIRAVESTELRAGGGAPGTGVRGERKSIKAANDLFESAKLYMSTINPARRRGNFNIAADKLRELIETYPESDKIVEAHYNLGLIYQDGMIDRYEDAVREFDRVKELDPGTSGDSRILAAKIVDRLGRLQEAYDRYADVVEHDGNVRNVEWAKARRVQLEPHIRK